MASKKKVPAGGPSDSGAGDPKPDAPPAPVAPPIDALTRLELYLEKNWRKVVIVLVVFVLAVVAYFYMKYKREDAMTQANHAFTSATTRTDLEKVADDHPGSVAAGSALFSIADRQMAASEYEAAVATLKKFTADFPDHPLYYRALLGLGSAAEKQGKSDEAAGYFQQVIGAGDKSELVPLATICKIELMVAKGELDKAKEEYEAFGVNFTGSPFVEKAIDRLKAVEMRIKLANAPEAPEEPADPEPGPEKTEPEDPTKADPTETPPADTGGAPDGTPENEGTAPAPGGETEGGSPDGGGVSPEAPEAGQGESPEGGEAEGGDGDAPPVEGGSE